MPVKVLGSCQQKIINFLTTTVTGNNVNTRQSLRNCAVRFAPGRVTTGPPASCQLPHDRGGAGVPPAGVCPPHAWPRGRFQAEAPLPARPLSALAGTSSPSAVRCPAGTRLSVLWRAACLPRGGWYTGPGPRCRPGEGAGRRGVSCADRAEVRAVWVPCRGHAEPRRWGQQGRVPRSRQGRPALTRMNASHL